MKLRNKKTGEKVSKIDVSEDYGAIWVMGNVPKIYRSLAELNEEWEDYKPVEPLIKDEKIREIIRQWTKINGVVGLTYYEGENCLEDIFRNEIHFNQLLGLEDGRFYTASELFGEEKE